MNLPQPEQLNIVEHQPFETIHEPTKIIESKQLSCENGSTYSQQYKLIEKVINDILSEMNNYVILHGSRAHNVHDNKDTTLSCDEFMIFEIFLSNYAVSKFMNLIKTTLPNVLLINQQEYAQEQKQERTHWPENNLIILTMGKDDKYDDIIHVSLSGLRIISITILSSEQCDQMKKYSNIVSNTRVSNTRVLDKNLVYAQTIKCIMDSNNNNKLIDYVHRYNEQRPNILLPIIDESKHRSMNVIINPRIPIGQITDMGNTILVPVSDSSYIELYDNSHNYSMTYPFNILVDNVHIDGVPDGTIVAIFVKNTRGLNYDDYTTFYDRDRIYTSFLLVEYLIITLSVFYGKKYNNLIDALVSLHTYLITEQKNLENVLSNVDSHRVVHTPLVIEHKPSANNNDNQVIMSVVGNYDTYVINTWGFGIEHETQIYRKIHDEEINILKSYVQKHLNDVNDVNNAQNQRLFALKSVDIIEKDVTIYKNYNINIAHWLLHNITKIPINVNINYIADDVYDGKYPDDTTNIMEFKTMIKERKITSELSSYTGTNCSHESLRNGANCNFEVITGTPTNFKVGQCVAELKHIETTTLNVITQYGKKCNSHYLAKCGAEPFLCFSKSNNTCQLNDKTLEIIHNKSGSYHVNITLPMFRFAQSTQLTDMELKEQITTHLKFARALQLLTPLFIAFYGTPDFRAIYNERIEEKDNMKNIKFSNTSFRLMSSGTRKSAPLPCTYGLYDTFSPDRTINSDVLWYQTYIAWDTCGYIKKENVANPKQKTSYGVEFRRDPEKVKNIGFGFEYRIFDDFSSDYIEEILQLITFVADLIRLIDINTLFIVKHELYATPGVKAIYEHIMYDAQFEDDFSHKKEMRTLFNNVDFNKYIANVMMNGNNPNFQIPESIMKLYNSLFYEIPTYLCPDISKTFESLTEKDSLRQILRKIHHNMYHLCTKSVDCLYTSTLIDSDVKNIPYKELTCVSEIVTNEYIQIIDDINAFVHKNSFLHNDEKVDDDVAVPIVNAINVNAVDVIAANTNMNYKNIGGKILYKTIKNDYLNLVKYVNKYVNTQK